MTERADITVDWGIFSRSSPRIIEVAAPSTNLVIQDLVDTLRSNTLPAGEADDSLENLDDESIISAEGKVPVQPGVFTGIVATLQNAKLRFEARPGPDVVLCSVTAGDLVSFLSDVGSHTGGDSNTVLIDAAASFISFGIEANGSFTVENLTDGSSARVDTVDSATQITTDGLTGGSDNLFEAGDVIRVSGFATSPIAPSANTTVSYLASVAPVIVSGNFSDADALRLAEVYKRLGLDLADPVEVTPAGVDSDSGDIDIDFSGDGVNLTRMERQP